MLGSAEKILVSISFNKPADSRAPFFFDVISVALILAVMAGLFYLYRVQDQERELSRDSVAALAQAKAIVSNELDSIAADGLLLASEAPGPESAETFKKLLQLRPHYRHVAMADRNGRPVIKIVRQQTEVVVLTAEQLRSEPALPVMQRGFAVAPGSVYASAPLREPGTATNGSDNDYGNRGLVIYFIVPQFSDYLARPGAVVIGYDVDGLLATMRTITLESGRHFDLIDSTGKSIDPTGHPNAPQHNQHVWTTDIAIASAGELHERHLQLQYHVDAAVIAHDRRTQAWWAFALWLIVLGPTATLFCLARGARASDRAAKDALAQSEERLLEAERLARIGHWRWQANEGVMMLSPQAAAMLGCPPGDQHKRLQDITALHALEDEQRFSDRVQHVMNTGESSSADIRVLTLGGERWLHSIIRPTRDVVGAISGVFGTLQDISSRKKLEQELLRLKTDYAALLDNLPAGVMKMDLDGRWALVNEGFLRMTGATRDMYEGRHYLDTVQHPHAEQLINESLELMRLESPASAQAQSILVQGGTRWFRIDRVPRWDAEGKPAGLIVFVVDITSLKTAEQQLLALTTEREMMLNRIPAGVVYKAVDGRIIRANRVAAGFAGVSAEAMEGRRMDEIYPLGDHDLGKQIDAEVIRTGQPKLGVHISGSMANGSLRWFEIDVFPNFDASGNVSGIVVFGVDITLRKQAEEQVAYLAMHDPLTDLCNRRLLTDRLAQTLAHCARRSRHCALLFIDLDHFKTVNDVHGHDIGDILLEQVAQRLRACVRNEDTVSRVGGDEFVILLADTTGTSDAVMVAGKVRALVGQTFVLHSVSLEIGCSIGIAGFPEHGSTEYELMRAADTAMYVAKASGRNTICVSSLSADPTHHDAA